MAKTRAKTTKEIQAARQAGRIVGALLYQLSTHIRVGQSAKELDELAERFILEKGGTPAFKNYEGYPATICVSVNDAVVHGIPNKKPFAAGDIIGIDAGAIVDGLYADAAVTVALGVVTDEAERLIDVTARALDVGIAELLPQTQIGNAQFAIQQAIEAADFGIIRELTGHGIGMELHEEPHIPNYGRPKTGLRLVPGMTICLEPMVTAGRPEIIVDSDGWTIRTADHSLGAHFEHTILITENEPEILTMVAPW